MRAQEWIAYLELPSAPGRSGCRSIPCLKAVSQQIQNTDSLTTTLFTHAQVSRHTLSGGRRARRPYCAPASSALSGSWREGRQELCVSGRGPCAQPTRDRRRADRLEASSTILDFGCGCGRVISSLSKLTGAQLFGTDIDAEAIEWCNRSLPSVGKFSVNDKLPPFPFDDNAFDLVYSISIFTHLPEDMQFAWLGELNRVLKPSGYAILTTHGSSLFPSHLLSAEITSEFNEKEFTTTSARGRMACQTFIRLPFILRITSCETGPNFLMLKRFFQEARATTRFDYLSKENVTSVED